MNHILRVSCVFGAALLVHSGSARAEPSAEAGRAVYTQHCAQCHGERLMTTGAAPDLKLLGGDQRGHFDEMVRNGKGQMPAWAGMITDEEIDQLWAYIRSRAEN